MTTTRRQARASQGAATVRIDGAAAPAELLDPDHPLWRDTPTYRAWMADHGWADALPVAERLGARSHPHNRRNYASEAWALEAGVFLTSPGHADWNQLRRAGLIG
jgi:hypothetical protein